MKRLFNCVITALCAIIAAFALAACSDAGAPEHTTTSPQYSVAVSDLQNELKSFLSSREDRTSYSDGEIEAALYLKKQLNNYGYDDVVIQEFTTSEDDVRGLNSQNVIAVYDRTSSSDAKNVVVGAYYDNRYSPAYKGASATDSAGALSNGTGVATALAIARYFGEERPALDCKVTFVFFGASSITTAGAEAYYDKMTAKERDNTVLMIELQRLGVDHVYAYTDERETDRENFFDGISSKNGLDIYKVTQKSPIMTGVTNLEGVPFYRWAHSGLFSVFHNARIPTLNIVGANWETVDFSDRESKDHANISFTANDDMANLERLHPDYAEKMASAATLVIKSIEDADFVNVMTGDKASFPETDILFKNWIWALIAVGALMIVAAVVFAVNAHLAKKYPIVAPRPRKMKMAVFGMDYEDKNSGDIFLDIKPSNDVGDIFPGVPNNSRADDNTLIDGIFAPLFDGRAPDAKKSEAVDEPAKKSEAVDEPAKESDANKDAEKPNTDSAVTAPKKTKESTAKKSSGTKASDGTATSRAKPKSGTVSGEKKSSAPRSSRSGKKGGGGDTDKEEK